MALIIIGILLLVVAFAFRKESRFINFIPMIRIGALVLIALGFSVSCFKQIEAGQIGVQSLFGKVSDKTLESGLNVVNPPG